MKDTIITMTLCALILASALYTSNTMGYAKGLDAHNEATSDYLYFSDYQSSYKLHKDSQFRTKRIEDITGVYYFIYIWYGDNSLVVEYSDTEIDGEFTFAKHWADSFTANFTEAL